MSHELAQLISKLQLANGAFAISKPFMTDTEYDQLWNTVYNIDPTCPALYHTANDPRLASTHRPHKFPIMGTQKAFCALDLKPFITRFSQSKFLIQPKYDGCAAVLYRQERGKLLLILEGNGTSGRDVSYLLPKITINFKLREVNSVELVIPKALWQPSMGANPRNTVAGWIASHQEVPNVIEAVSHEYGPLWDYLPLQELSADLQAEHLLSLYEKWSQLYPLDGIMIKIADEKERILSGHNGSHHWWSIAWKPPMQVAVTTVLDIEWNVSRTGRVVPTIIYEPLILCDTTNTRVTGNNAKWIADRNICIGSKIMIGKAGEIIPKIVKVFPSDAAVSSLPEQCPACGATLLPLGVDLICPSADCISMLSTSLAYFYSDKGMDLRSFAENMLFELLQDKDLYLVLKDHPYALLDPHYFNVDVRMEEVWGTARYMLYYENLLAINGKRTMADFIAGLGLSGLGRKSTLNCYYMMKGQENAAKVRKLVVENFLIGLETFDRFTKYNTHFKFLPLPGKIEAFYSITGELSLSRPEMINYLSGYNWQYVQIVTKKTNYLIKGHINHMTEKEGAAIKQNIPIISEDDLVTLLSKKKEKENEIRRTKEMDN